MKNNCRGWADATPDSPFHPYNWSVRTYHYIYKDNKLNTLRIHGIIATEVDGYGDYTIYGYPQLEVLELTKEYDQYEVWKVHNKVIDHLIHCLICTDKALCDRFYEDFNFPKHIDDHDPSEDWDIPF